MQSVSAFPCTLTPDDLCARIVRVCGFRPEEAEPVARKLLASELTAESARDLKEVLWRYGLAARWNVVLDRDRALFLAGRIDELVCEGATVIDVLSGTGTLSAAVRRCGYRVVEVERPEHYPQRVFDHHVRDIHVVDPALLRGEVGLIIASLHHEESLDRFIGWLSRVRVDRWIVVENLRDAETDADLHRRFDWFFNRCLNDFGAECPGWYWRREQWLDVLSSLGEARWLSRTTEVPGIPFAYDFFEVLR